MKKIIFISKGLKPNEVYGIHRYSLELLKELDKIIDYHSVELLVGPSEKNDFHFKNIKVVKIGRNINGFGILSSKIENYLYKNYYAKKYIVAQNAISVDTLLLFPLFGCEVITIYDCTMIKYPQYYKSKWQKRFRKKVLSHQKKAIKKCKLIITDSETAKKDIISCYRIKESLITVIPCGWQHFKLIDEDEGIIKKLGLNKGEYFFALGSVLPHKNIKWIINAAKSNPQYNFIISGSIRSDIQDFSIPSNLSFVGYLSDPEVKCLMKYCKAFIHPAFYEGFGIPPLEAMSTGTDCIISNKGALPEVYKQSAWYIDPYDYQNINIDKIMSSPKEKNDVVLSEYSWEKSAKKLWSVLKELSF